MNPLVTIITPTYNKPTYFVDCVRSVLEQTYQDWIWWIVYNGDTLARSTYTFPTDPRVEVFNWGVEDRFRAYVPAQIVNKYYSMVETPYIYFLADDDLVDKDGMQKLLEAIGDKDAIYGRCEVQNEQPNGIFETACWCFDGQNVGLGTNVPKLNCVLDSSQILHTKDLWNKATADGWQLTDDIREAGHADGILLDRLAEFATVYFVPQRINIHRRTSLSGNRPIWFR